MLLRIEAEIGERRRQDVLPHRLARAAVEEPDVLARPRRAQRGDVFDVLVRHHLARPTDGSAGSTGEVGQGSLTGDCEIVVSGEADHGLIARELDAGVGLCAVADEVAETPDLIDGAARDVSEHGLERVPVCVNVRDDCDPHRARRTGPLLPARAPAVLQSVRP